MDGVREWRIRNGPMLTVLAVGIGVGLFVFGLGVSMQWAIGQYTTPKVAEAVLWRGAFTAAAGGMLLTVARRFPPTAQTREIGS